MKVICKIRFIQMIPIFLLLLCLLTACARKETEGEESFRASSPGAAENDSGVENAENGTGVQQELSVDNANRDILAACAGTRITQTMESAAGRSISVDAEVCVDGISRISCYRYVPRLYTEEFRKALFQKMHPAENWDVNEAAVYDAEKDAWEFVTPRGESWMYQVRVSGISGEQILDYERAGADLDYAEETKVSPAQLQRGEDRIEEDLSLFEITGSNPSEMEQIGLQIIGSVAVTGAYSCSYIHICGEDGAHPYARLVYKQVIDGMPVTVWHNLSTVVADGSIFPIKIWGSLFSTKEIGLDSPILSAEEAVTAMQEQIDSIQIQEETQLSVTKIALEYLAVMSSDGEPEIVPVWRFLLGNNEMERSLMSEKILAVNAVSGELIWEERGVLSE